MAVRIVLDKAVLNGIHEKAAQAALETMEAVRTDLVSSQTMPYDVGTMQGSLHADQFEAGTEIHTSLQTDGPQARRLYFHPEYNFQTGNNPNAGADVYKRQPLDGADGQALSPEQLHVAVHGLAVDAGRYRPRSRGRKRRPGVQDNQRLQPTRLRQWRGAAYLLCPVSTLHGRYGI